jgi:hypothetical protein
LIGIHSKVEAVDRRRRRFKDQSVPGIVWHMLTSLDAAPKTKTVAQEHAFADASPSRALDAARSVPVVSRRLLAVISALVLAGFLLVSGIVLTKLYQSSPQSAPDLGSLRAPAAAVTPQPTIELSPLTGAALVQARAFGTGLLLQPQDALRLPDGGVAIADTGHHRVVLLDGAGKLAVQITHGGSGPLQTPFSLALTPSHQLLVLDSDAGQIDQYTTGGKLVAASDLALHLGHSRGIAVDAVGHVLVADPAMNAIVTLGANLAILRTQVGTSGSGGVLFNQPSAVAASPDGSVYVVDSQSGRLVHYSPAWASLQQWPLPVPDTQHSPRIVVLRDGRVLASDPVHNALLVYDASLGQPQSFRLSAGGEPLGLAPGGHDDMLVTCAAADQVLELKVPGLTL